MLTHIRTSQTLAEHSSRSQGHSKKSDIFESDLYLKLYYLMSTADVNLYLNLTIYGSYYTRSNEVLFYVHLNSIVTSPFFDRTARNSEPWLAYQTKTSIYVNMATEVFFHVISCLSFDVALMRRLSLSLSAETSPTQRHKQTWHTDGGQYINVHPSVLR